MGSVGGFPGAVGGVGGLVGFVESLAVDEPYEK